MPSSIRCLSECPPNAGVCIFTRLGTLSARMQECQAHAVPPPAFMLQTNNKKKEPYSNRHAAGIIQPSITSPPPVTAPAEALIFARSRASLTSGDPAKAVATPRHFVSSRGKPWKATGRAVCSSSCVPSGRPGRRDWHSGASPGRDSRRWLPWWPSRRPTRQSPFRSTTSGGASPLGAGCGPSTAS